MYGGHCLSDNVLTIGMVLTLETDYVIRERLLGATSPRFYFLDN